MKLRDLLKKVGSSVLREVIPGGGLIVDVINGFLPGDKQLPNDATADDLDRAVNKLPADQRAMLMGREFDVEETKIKESYDTVRTMLEHDAKNPQSTRPYIAKGAFHVVAFVCFVVVSLWASAVYSGDEKMISAIMDGWQFILAAIGPLITLLWAYFGVLRDEHKTRLQSSIGKEAKGAISSIITAFRGK